MVKLTGKFDTTMNCMTSITNPIASFTAKIAKEQSYVSNDQRASAKRILKSKIKKRTTNGKAA